MSALPPVILLMGPTASGKTGLALRLAERLGAELISVDSAQVYRGMDIGTAKPAAELRIRFPHHLVDIVDPCDAYSAARFCADAGALIDQVRARDRIPLLVGGTMLYFRALQQGLSALPSADQALRARLEADAAREGWPALHARLHELDPEAGARLHPNDSQRIQRALEIVELTGQPVASFYDHDRPGGLQGRVVKLALSPLDRAELHRRIEQRFDGMLREGLLEEVARLRARGDLHPDLPSMRAVGYRQLWEHLDGATTLAQARDKGIAATRQLAKRQLTWLRSEDDLAWLDPDDPSLFDKALNLLD